MSGWYDVFDSALQSLPFHLGSLLLPSHVLLPVHVFAVELNHVDFITVVTSDPVSYKLNVDVHGKYCIGHFLILRVPVVNGLDLVSCWIVRRCCYLNYIYVSIVL